MKINLVPFQIVFIDFIGTFIYVSIFNELIENR